MSTSVPPNASGPRAASTPFAELEDFFRSIGFRPTWRASDTAPDIRLDVGEDEANYVIRAEIPGVGSTTSNCRSTAGRCRSARR